MLRKENLKWQKRMDVVVVLEMCVSNFCWRSIYLEMAGVNKMNHKLLNVLEDGGRMRTRDINIVGP